MPELEQRIKIPDKLIKFVDTLKRYCVLYGGRGSAKSWTIAAILVLRAVQSKKLVLCTREIQNSIKDSVHKLISDTIERFGLNHFFDIQKDKIIGKNGSTFIFKGLRHSISEIKSTEGIDFCWVEEAQNVSDEAWKILIPTVRAEGSQIWISFNPDLEDDPVYKRFVVDNHPNALVENVNYWDNPFFNSVLRDEMNLLREKDFEEYLWIWEGQIRVITEACIFKGYFSVKEFDSPDLKARFGADFGYSPDPATLIKSYVDNDILYIRNEAYGSNIEIDEYPAFYESVPEAKSYEIIADCARNDLISHIGNKGFKIKGCKKFKGSVEAGIQFMKNFNHIYIHPDCVNTIREFKIYSFKTDRQTGEILPIILDKHNHCFIGKTQILTDKGYKRIDKMKVDDLVMTRKGFRRVKAVFNNGRKVVNERVINSKSLTGTGTHNIISELKKIEIRNLRENDIIFKWRPVCQRISMEKVRLSSLKERITGGILNLPSATIECIFDARTRAGRHIYTSIFMRRFMGKSKKGFMFTIKMKTLSIMTFPILSVCVVALICHNILLSTKKTIEKKLKNTWILLDLLQKNGIEVRRAENGILNMRKKLLLLKRENAFVCDAGKISKQNIKATQSIALMLVSLLIVGRKVLTLLVRLVVFVVKNIGKANIAKQKHAQEAVQVVYDLEIDGEHEYFANDILVSNCIDAIRYSLEDIMKINTVQELPEYSMSDIFK